MKSPVIKGGSVKLKTMQNCLNPNKTSQNITNLKMLNNLTFVLKGGNAKPTAQYVVESPFMAEMFPNKASKILTQKRRKKKKTLATIGSLGNLKLVEDSRTPKKFKATSISRDPDNATLPQLLETNEQLK
jgi:hypothetical protein